MSTTLSRLIPALLLSSVLLLTSCSRLTTAALVRPPALPPDLTEPCPAMLEALPQGPADARTVARALQADVEDFAACSARHNRLVEALRQREAMQQGEVKR